MKIVIGSDYMGHPYKQSIIDSLLNAGHYIADVGIHDNADIEYPDVVTSAAKGILAKEFDRAILIGETGNGMAIVANKYFGIYAAVCRDVQNIQDSILKNNCNVLCIESKFFNSIAYEKLIEYWLTLKFDRQSENATIISKIQRIEEDQRIKTATYKD